MLCHVVCLCTGVVDEQVQSGLGLQERLSEAADRLQTGQVQLHVEHVSTSCFLEQHHHRVRTMKEIYFRGNTTSDLITSTV